MEYYHVGDGRFLCALYFTICIYLKYGAFRVRIGDAAARVRNTSFVAKEREIGAWSQEYTDNALLLATTPSGKIYQFC